MSASCVPFPFRNVDARVRDSLLEFPIRSRFGRTGTGIDTGICTVVGGVRDGIVLEEGGRKGGYGMGIRGMSGMHKGKKRVSMFMLANRTKRCSANLCTVQVSSDW